MAIFNGDSLDNVYVGTPDDDQAWGLGGSDTLSGGGGQDDLQGGDGNDILNGDGGDDRIWGGPGADVHNGGAGQVDYARYDDAVYGDLVVSLETPADNTGVAAGDTYSGIEGLILGSGNDTGTGNAYDNYLYGLEGNDILHGRGGWDRIDGGDGDDVIHGNEATDFLYGSAGNDVLYGDEGGDILDGGGGDDVLHGPGDQLYGGAGFDTAVFEQALGGPTLVVVASSLSLSSVEALRLSQGSDFASGTTAADRIEGEDGDDTLVGLAGDDDLRGGGGSDWLHGGAGSDQFTGGAGADVFVLDAMPQGAEADALIDFTSGSDRIGLDRNVFASLGAAGPLDAARFRAGANVSAADTDDFVLYDTATGALWYDADGSGVTAPVRIALLEGTPVLAAADLLVTDGVLLKYVGDGLDNVFQSPGSVTLDAQGLGGNDQISGAGGHDLLQGGQGDDALSGQGGNDRLWSYLPDIGQPEGRSADIGFELEGLQGGDGDDLLFGGAGDYFSGGAGFDTAFVNMRGATYDIGFYQSFDVEFVKDLEGSDAADSVYVISAPGQSIRGNGGADALSLTGGSGGSVEGGDGDDSLYSGPGADLLDGGPGYDRARYDHGYLPSGGVVFWLDSPHLNTGAAAGDTFAGIEEYVLSLWDDVAYGGADADRLDGSMGRDRIYGQAGDDHLFGGSDHDLLWGGLGADALDGGDGFDYVRYDDASYAAMTVALFQPALNTGPAAGDTYANIEGLILGYFDDLGYGSNSADYIYGINGNDRLYGQGGDDNVFGGDGNDLLWGGLGADHLDGGASFDYARYDDATFPSLVASLLNPALNTGAAAGDTYASVEGLILGFFDDTGHGNDNDNYLYGINGNDTLHGQGGNDHLFGGIGNDTFAFDSALGAGNVDIVGDFSVGADKIQLENAIFTALTATGTLDVANFRSGAGITTAGDADDYVIYDATTGALYYDADGNGGGSSAVQFAVVSGHPALSAADVTIV